MRPKWQDQGALTAWLGGQDRAVVGLPALGAGDSYERGWELGQRRLWGLWVGTNTHNSEGRSQGLPSAVTVKLWGTRVGGGAGLCAVPCRAQMHCCSSSQEGATHPYHTLSVDSWHPWVSPGTRSGQHLSFVLWIQDGTLRWQ